MIRLKVLCILISISAEILGDERIFKSDSWGGEVFRREQKEEH